MTDAPLPYALPDKLDPGLAETLAYWRGLIRGQASSMPYWDDVKLSDMADRAERVMLVAAFEKPERFRFEIVGSRIASRYGEELQGLFADEVDIRSPLEFFRAQASVTVEGRAPTFYAGQGYARLLLPLWGDGHISMLLGAFTDI
ncbi:MAG: hypothetical protein U0942_12180 [Parvibaculum sp.]|uniref:hypothetical protein n=1 Tax=Parvibaculum sp. TaxID=2024848 RepID=UPI002AB869F3|nr:hypothetical protein [Parvibaculum sp.]MDZ4382085.1 hypothetical protein [Parvibaculum sp.]